MSFVETLENFEVSRGMSIWSLGGPSVAVKTPQCLVYLDLFTGPNPLTSLHRATEDILSAGDIRRVDAVLATHHDIDHCHRGSLQPVHDNTDALLIGPRSAIKLFREWDFSPARMVELSAGQCIQIKDLRIWAMPCNDFFDPDANSYVLESGGVTVFDGGDSLYFSGFIQVGRRFSIDLAMINFAKNPPGEIYYMNHAHVARTAVELGARIVLPKHYDLWQEFLDDPSLLIPKLEPKGIRVEILPQGGRLALTPA